MWSDVFYLTSILFAAPAMVLIGVYAPLFTYYAIRLAQRTDLAMPPSFQNFWGLNRLGLLMHPKVLDNEAKVIHQKAISAAKRMLLGVALGIATLLLSGEL